MENVANLTYLIILAVLFGYIMLKVTKKNRSQPNKKNKIKIIPAILVWIAIFITVMLAYLLVKNPTTNLKSIGNLMLGNPVTNNNNEIVIYNKQGNHFIAKITINNQIKSNFIVDTGASHLVITEELFRQLGQNPEKLIYNIPAHTANGISYGAGFVIDKIQIANFQLENVFAIVKKKKHLNTNLMGMSILKQFSSFEFKENSLILKP